jgi:hypothetical protein
MDVGTGIKAYPSTCHSERSEESHHTLACGDSSVASLPQNDRREKLSQNDSNAQILDEG